jgi:hypothetical protein
MREEVSAGMVGDANGSCEGVTLADGTVVRDAGLHPTENRRRTNPIQMV